MCAKYKAEATIYRYWKSLDRPDFRHTEIGASKALVIKKKVVKPFGDDGGFSQQVSLEGRTFR